MKISDFKRVAIWLLGISFLSAVISDVAYGTIENAKIYAIGSFLSQASALSFSFFTIVILLWFVFDTFLGNFHDLIYHVPCRCDGCVKTLEVPKTKKVKK